MIRKHEPPTPEQAAQDFAEWASLVSGELFVQIVAYADESGTHDPTGVLKGSREAAIGGIIAPVEEWVQFCRAWQRVLNKYKTDYFHFNEWVTASRVACGSRKPPSDFKKNPFKNLDTKALDGLLMELAEIAGSGNKIIVQAMVQSDVFQKEKEKGNIPAEANPYELCIDRFFDAVVGLIGYQRPPWKRQPISFFFDQRKGDKEWLDAVYKIFNSYKEKNCTFKDITFSDKEDRLPLQAADMVAYRTRQQSQNWVNEKEPILWTGFDNALFKTTYDFLDRANKGAIGKEALRLHAQGKLKYKRGFKL